MCTRFTHLYQCSHFTLSTITCASSRTLPNGKCDIFKEKQVEHEYECDDCEEAALEEKKSNSTQNSGNEQQSNA